MKRIINGELEAQIKDIKRVNIPSLIPNNYISDEQYIKIKDPIYIEYINSCSFIIDAIEIHTKTLEELENLVNEINIHIDDLVRKCSNSNNGFSDEELYEYWGFIHLLEEVKYIIKEKTITRK